MNGLYRAIFRKIKQKENQFIFNTENNCKEETNTKPFEEIENFRSKRRTHHKCAKCGVDVGMLSIHCNEKWRQRKINDNVFAKVDHFEIVQLCDCVGVHALF